MVKINYNIFAPLPRHQDNLAKSSLVGQCRAKRATSSGISLPLLGVAGTEATEWTLY